MKFKRVLKIILLITSVLFTGFLSVLMYVVFYVENAPFEYSMLIPLSMISTGFLSVSYHFKTLKFYNIETKQIMFKEPVLWGGNILFALSLVLTGLYLGYIFHTVYETNLNDKIYIAYIVILLMLVFGICLVIEARNLYNQILKSDADLFKGSIDDIGGGDN